MVVECFVYTKRKSQVLTRHSINAAGSHEAVTQTYTRNSKSKYALTRAYATLRLATDCVRMRKRSARALQ